MQRNIIKQMKKHIEKMFLDEHGKIILEYFDISLWIDSKLTNKSMAQILKKRTAECK